MTIYDSSRKCINCSGDHLAISRDCPFIIQNERIHALAATCNISIIKAK